MRKENFNKFNNRHQQRPHNRQRPQLTVQVDRVFSQDEIVIGDTNLNKRKSENGEQFNTSINTNMSYEANNIQVSPEIQYIFNVQNYNITYLEDIMEIIENNMSEILDGIVTVHNSKYDEIVSGIFTNKQDMFIKFNLFLLAPMEIMFCHPADEFSIKIVPNEIASILSEYLVIDGAYNSSILKDIGFDSNRIDLSMSMATKIVSRYLETGGNLDKIIDSTRPMGLSKIDMLGLGMSSILYDDIPTKILRTRVRKTYDSMLTMFNSNTVEVTNIRDLINALMNISGKRELFLLTLMKLDNSKFNSLDENKKFVSQTIVDAILEVIENDLLLTEKRNVLTGFITKKRSYPALVDFNKLNKRKFPNIYNSIERSKEIAGDKQIYL